VEKLGEAGKFYRAVRRLRQSSGRMRFASRQLHRCLAVEDPDMAAVTVAVADVLVAARSIEEAQRVASMPAHMQQNRTKRAGSPVTMVVEVL
jgi:thioredoxin-like negative regulator of GroEL